MKMKCPNCGNIENEIFGSRPESDTIAVYRLECSTCGMRFVIRETIEPNEHGLKDGDDIETT